MTLTDLLYAGKGECVGKWWLAQCAHGVYMLTHTHLETHIISSSTNVLEYLRCKFKRINSYSLINLTIIHDLGAIR